jgi:hypothetical protein
VAAGKREMDEIETTCAHAAETRMTPTESLLRSCAWHAEKLLRRRGSFGTELWMAERADGSRQLFEVACTAPAAVTGAEVLQGLAADARANLDDLFETHL